MTPRRPAESAPAIDTSEPPDLTQLEQLFHAHYSSLCEYAWHYVKSRELAEELVQGLFVRLWELRTGGGSHSLSVAYLYTAARNRAIGHLRREGVARRFADEVMAVHEMAPPGETIVEAIEAQDLATAAERAVAALPGRCRLIFLMSRQEGLGYAEIATALGISKNTVETQIARALKKLRIQLLPYLGLAISAVHSASTALRAIG